MIKRTIREILQNHFADQISLQQVYITRRQRFLLVGTTEQKCKSRTFGSRRMEKRCK